MEVETDPEAARRHCRASLAITEEGASDVVYANVLATLALMAERDGDLHQALHLVRRSLIHFDVTGDRPPMSGSFGTAGRLLAHLASPETLAVFVGGFYDGWLAPLLPILTDRYLLPQEVLDSLPSLLGPDRYLELRSHGAALGYEAFLSFVLDSLSKVEPALK